MMQKDSGIHDPGNKAKVFFLIGYGFLLAMALCWSVDDSLIYIFFGAAAYFLFLGFYTSPKQNKFQEQGGGSTYSQFSDFSTDLKNIFQKRKGDQKQNQRTYSTQPISPESARRIVFLIAAAIFATFFIFLIGSIIFGGEDESSFYFQAAEQEYWNGNYDSAYINYRRAWQSNETYAEAMVGYGNVLAIRKQTDSALIMFDKALTINPDYREAAYAKAATYYNLERYNESIGIVVPLLDAHQDYYDAMLLAGDCYYAMRQFDEALSWYEKAYENEGSRSRILCHIMAYLYDTKGNTARAIDLYKEALNYDSSVVEIHKRLGELLPGPDGEYYRTQAISLEQK